MNNRDKRVLFGFLAGAAVGAIAGILLAPETGKVTRGNLAEKGLKFKDDFSGTVKKGMDKFNSMTESAFSLVNSYANESTAQNKNGNVGNNVGNQGQNF